jgi:hypothetical protein
LFCENAGERRRKERKSGKQKRSRRLEYDQFCLFFFLLL